MDTSHHQLCSETPHDLTLEHLRSSKFEKLSKDILIEAYIKGQHLHAKSYAEEGQALFSSWGRRSPEKTKPITPLHSDFGFDTPVLKARVTSPEERVLDGGVSKSVTECGKPEKKQQLSTRRLSPGNILRGKFTGKPQRAAAVPGLHVHTPSKRRKSSAQEDEEHAARLNERRDRKRARRAVVNPSERPVCSVETGIEDENENRRLFSKTKRKKDRKNLVSPGFALMHGFTATNVGKNRLTIKPSTIGVFSKGKASAKTSVKRKKILPKKGLMPKLFSEHDFLSKLRKVSSVKSQQPISSDSNPASVSNSTASQLSPTKLLITNRDFSKISTKIRDQKTADIPDGVTKGRDVSMDVQSKGKTAIEKSRAQSEVWDIELQDPSEPQEIIPPIPSSTPNEGTVVLDTHASRWAGVELAATDVDRPIHGSLSRKAQSFSDVPVQEPISLHPHSPSLGPSDSASKVGQRVLSRSNLQGTLGLSKYFSQAEIEPRSLHLDEVVCPGVVSQHSALKDKVASNAISSVTSPETFSRLGSNDGYHSDYHPLQAVDNSLETTKHFAQILSSPNSLEALQEYEANNMVPQSDNVFRMLTGMSDFEVDVAEQHSMDENYREPLSTPQFDPPFCGSVGETLPQDMYGRQEVTGHGDWQSENEDHDAMEIQEGVEHCCPGCSNIRLEVPCWGSYVEGNTECRFSRDHSLDGYSVCSETVQGTDGQDLTWAHLPYNRQCDVELDPNTYDTYDHPSNRAQFQIRPLTSCSIGHGAEESEDGSLVLAERFSQGRALLLGLSGQDSQISKVLPCVSRAERDVASSLKGHWRPQRL